MNFVALLKLVQQGEGSKVTLLNSQNCEQYFGMMRTQSTQGQFGAAFDVSQALDIIKNTHVLQTAETKLAHTPFKFPSSSKKQEPHIESAPMTSAEIASTLNEMIREVNAEFNDAGITCGHGDICDFFKPIKAKDHLLRANILAARDGQETDAMSDEELTACETANPLKVVKFKELCLLDVKSSGTKFKCLRKAGDDPSNPENIETIEKSCTLWIADGTNVKKSLNRTQRVQAQKRKEMEVEAPPTGHRNWKSNGVELGAYVVVKTVGNGRNRPSSKFSLQECKE
jgi:hypothetical protein